MRIGVATWSSRHVGGIETYLRSVIRALVECGHEVGYFCEVDTPGDRERVNLPTGVPRWCAAELGRPGALTEMEQWRPDLIFSHGLHDSSTEAALQKMAPAVLLAHAYHGTCISGSKTHRFPEAKPCTLAFGTQCLLQYYPRRCGGLNPLTMLRAFGVQRSRQQLLSGYRVIVTLSSHMRGVFKEAVQEKVPVRHIPGFLTDLSPSPESGKRVGLDGDAIRLLFLGRLEILKGGQLLLQTLPALRTALARPLQVTFAGDGPERSRWEQQASAVRRACPDVQITFPGWVTDADKPRLWQEHHLLVMPSIWPEPFGLTGLEAGAQGLPTAAFAVGGIPDWLQDGVNGHLAPGNPPSAANLARAVTDCLRSPAHYADLCQGARRQASLFSLERHTKGLLEVFAQTTGVAEPCCT